MKRSLDINYKDVHIHKINVYYIVEPPNNGHTRSEAFVLCREVVLFSEVTV